MRRARRPPWRHPQLILCEGGPFTHYRIPYPQTDSGCCCLSCSEARSLGPLTGPPASHTTLRPAPAAAAAGRAGRGGAARGVTVKASAISVKEGGGQRARRSAGSPLCPPRGARGPGKRRAARAPAAVRSSLLILQLTRPGLSLACPVVEISTHHTRALACFQHVKIVVSVITRCMAPSKRPGSSPGLPLPVALSKHCILLPTCTGIWLSKGMRMG